MAIGVSMTPWQHWQQRHPERVALCLEEGTLTWRELNQRVQQYANAIAESGLNRADVLTLVGKNHPQTLFWLLSAMQLGVVCALTMSQPAAQLRSKLSALYRDEQCANVWLAPSAGLTLDELGEVNALSLPSSPSTHAGSVYHRDNLATLIFTSGSTGTPKAVAHTHAQHLASAQGLLAEFEFQSDDTWLLSLPLYHVSGLAIIYRWLAAGACLKIGGGQLAQDIEGVTHASLVPTQLKRLLDSGQKLTLTHVLLGGSHIPLTLAQQAAELGIETWLGYGMTEAASTVTAKQVDGQAGAGHVLAHRAVRVEEQRIYIGGDTLASGYYRQGLLHPFTDDQGWFDSKDLGYFDQDQLVIIGRADNLFISGGENIHCEEIESVLNRHPHVQLAMVIPVEDEEFGARSVAVVQSSAPFSDELGNEWCEGQLEKFKWPVAYFDMPDELTESGIKVSRQALKQWLANHQTRFRVMS
ncbi:o-succinylbenzoate--CoA ligase [Vibrio fluvialis]|uniref:o-succinylbenzoate--CoA ligase n=1 Tax=Vibrio fluvialis TaxID=676 RepID=UPI0018B07B1A